MENRVMTCVYCGQEYPQKTPSLNNEALTEHVRVCPKHPLRKAEENVELLRKALFGLIGVESKEDLEKMEAVIRFMPDSDADKEVAINAIHALLATMPNTGAERR